MSPVSGRRAERQGGSLEFRRTGPRSIIDPDASYEAARLLAREDDPLPKKSSMGRLLHSDGLLLRTEGGKAKGESKSKERMKSRVMIAKKREEVYVLKTSVLLGFDDSDDANVDADVKVDEEVEV